MSTEPQHSRKSFLKSTAVFSALTILSRLTGVIRTSTCVAVLGSGTFYDAYNAAEMIPFMLYEVVVGGLLTAIFLPMLVRVQEKHGKTGTEAWRAANLLIGTVGTILAVVSALVMILAPWLIQIQTMLCSDTKLADFAISAMYLRWFAPEIFLFGLCAISMAILNSHGKFAITAAAPIFSNIFMIGVLLSYHFGLFHQPQYLAIGATCAVAVQLLLMIPALHSLGMRIRPRIDFHDPLFKFIASVAPSLLILSIANLGATLARTNFLTPIDGGLSAYKNCFLVVMMPYGIIAVSIITVLSPTLSRHSANDKITDYRNALSLGLRTTIVIMTPIMVAATILAYPIVQFLFERGLFTSVETNSNALFLQCYATSILPYALVMFLTKAFFAAKDTKSPIIIGVFGAVLSIVLGATLVHIIGAPGVALASGITYTITSLISLFVISKYSQGIDAPNLLPTIVKTAIATAVMALAITPTLSFCNARQANLEVISHGESKQLRLPAFETSGNTVQIPSSKNIAALWPALNHDKHTTLTLDFDTNTSYILAIAPATQTTTTLSIAPIPFYKNAKTLENITVTVAEAKTTHPLERRHAWLLLKMPKDGQTPVITFTNSKTKSFRTINSAFTLVTCTAVGVAVYALMAFFLGLKELDFLYNRFRKRK